MNDKTINITLSLAQADVLAKYLKLLADSVESRAVLEVRPMNNEEDLLVSAFSWMFIEITGELNKVPQEDILQQRGDYNKYYRQYLERQSKQN